MASPRWVEHAGNWFLAAEVVSARVGSTGAYWIILGTWTVDAWRTGMLRQIHRGQAASVDDAKRAAEDAIADLATKILRAVGGEISRPTP